MKYQIIKTADGYNVKYQNGKGFNYVDDATSDYLGGNIKTWKTLKGAEKWCVKNCLVGEPDIEFLISK